MNIMTNTVSLTALIEMLRLLLGGLSILSGDIVIRCMITQCAPRHHAQGKIGKLKQSYWPRPFRGIPKAFYSMDYKSACCH